MFQISPRMILAQLRLRFLLERPFHQINPAWTFVMYFSCKETTSSSSHCCLEVGSEAAEGRWMHLLTILTPSSVGWHQAPQHGVQAKTQSTRGVDGDIHWTDLSSSTIAFGIGNWKGALQASNAAQEKKRQQTGSLRMAYKNHTLAEPFSLAAGGGQCIPSEVWTSPNRRWWDGDIWRQGRVAKPACIYLFGLLLPIVITVVVIWGSGVGKERERERKRLREREREVEAVIFQGNQKAEEISQSGGERGCMLLFPQMTQTFFWCRIQLFRITISLNKTPGDFQYN